MKNILLIDDDEVSNYLTGMIFKSLEKPPDYLVVKNGEEAIFYLNNRKKLNLLIILDIHMPVLDGFEFLEQLKDITIKNSHLVEVILCSASFSPRDYDKAKEYEILDFISKPITKEKLLPHFKEVKI
ncbi:N/A [soil metagenome]